MGAEGSAVVYVVLVQDDRPVMEVRVFEDAWLAIRSARESTWNVISPTMTTDPVDAALDRGVLYRASNADTGHWIEVRHKAVEPIAPVYGRSGA